MTVFLPFTDQGDCRYDTTLLSGICHCDPDWIGTDCFIPCINGTNHGDGVCTCDRTCDTGKFNVLFIKQETDKFEVVCVRVKKGHREKMSGLISRGKKGSRFK